MSTSICEVRGCASPVLAKGLCKNHYSARDMAARRAMKIADRPERVCERCGVQIPKEADPRRKFCSRECNQRVQDKRKRVAQLAGRGPRKCAVCDVMIPAEASTKKICCSFECSTTYQNRRKYQRVAAARLANREANPRTCGRVGCDKAIPASRPEGTEYCSKACRVAVGVQLQGERFTNRLRLYGMTAEQYEAMLSEQDGRCAICRTDEPGGKGGWHVDHDHESGVVRGLLCHRCNLMLGNAKDDPARLRAAAQYLERRFM